MFLSLVAGAVSTMATDECDFGSDASLAEVMLSVVGLGDGVPCVQGVTMALQQVYAAYTAMQANKEAGAALAHRRQQKGVVVR